MPNNQPPIEPKPSGPARLTRRDFLKSGLLLAAGSALAACGTAAEESGWQGQATRWVTPTPANLLPSPQPGPQTPAPAGLETFLALSSVLTGFDHLSPTLGAVYLQALQDGGGNLDSLYEQAGFQSGGGPTEIEALEQAGIFEQETTRSLADQIIQFWYTGMVPDGENSRVVTFVDALAWKSLTFTKPPTICGAYGFWAERPAGSY